MTYPPPGGDGGGLSGTAVVVLVVGILAVVAVMLIVTFYVAWVWGPRLARGMSGVTAPIPNGLPGDAVIESIADTGLTVSMKGVGAYAPDYRFVLEVTPPGGGRPYRVELKALVPRIYLPAIVPGARVGVLIDPADPERVSLDFTRIGPAST